MLVYSPMLVCFLYRHCALFSGDDKCWKSKQPCCKDCVRLTSSQLAPEPGAAEAVAHCLAVQLIVWVLFVYVCLFCLCMGPVMQPDLVVCATVLFCPATYVFMSLCEHCPRACVRYTQTKLAQLKDDPEFAEMFDDLKQNGMQALMKYYNDPKWLAKLGSKLDGVGPEQPQGARPRPPPQAPPDEITNLLDAAK